MKKLIITTLLFSIGIVSHAADKCDITPNSMAGIQLGMTLKQAQAL